MPRKPMKSTARPAKKRNPDVFRFIDFFVKTGEKILGAKPIIVRGKDGRLVSHALRKWEVGKLETLAVWFLAKKKNLRPLIGTMLSGNVLEELEREINKSSFWKEINKLMDKYYPRVETIKLWQPFSYKDITNMKEGIARSMRKI